MTAFHDRDMRRAMRQRCISSCVAVAVLLCSAPSSAAPAPVLSAPVLSAPVLPAPVSPSTEAAPAESQPAAVPRVTEPATAQAEGDPLSPLAQEAKDAYLAGAGHYNRRDFDAAITSFERSFAISPYGSTLHNLVISYKAAGRYIEALETAERYLGLPLCSESSDPLCGEPDYRVRVSDAMVKLKSKVGVLEVSVDVGVDLRGIELGGHLLPLDRFPKYLEPGLIEIRIRGQLPGEIRKRSIRIEAGQRTALLVSSFDAPVMLPIEPRDEDLRPRVDPELRRQRVRTTFYAGLGVTGASAIIAGVLGGLVIQANRKYDERCIGTEQECIGSKYPFAAARRFNALKPATNAMIGVTAGLAIATTVVALFAFSKPPKTRSRARTSQASKLRARVGASGLLVEF